MEEAGAKARIHLMAPDGLAKAMPLLQSCDRPSFTPKAEIVLLTTDFTPPLKFRALA
jgi:hypothetical protein